MKRLPTYTTIFNSKALSSGDAPRFKSDLIKKVSALCENGDLDNIIKRLYERQRVSEIPLEEDKRQRQRLVPVMDAINSNSSQSVSMGDESMGATSSAASSSVSTEDKVLAIIEYHTAMLRFHLDRPEYRISTLAVLRDLFFEEVKDRSDEAKVKKSTRKKSNFITGICDAFRFVLALNLGVSIKRLFPTMDTIFPKDAKPTENSSSLPSPSRVSSGSSSSSNSISGDSCNNAGSGNYSNNSNVATSNTVSKMKQMTLPVLTQSNESATSAGTTPQKATSISLQYNTRITGTKRNREEISTASHAFSPMTLSKRSLSSDAGIFHHGENDDENDEVMSRSSTTSTSMSSSALSPSSINTSTSRKRPRTTAPPNDERAIMKNSEDVPHVKLEEVLVMKELLETKYNTEIKEVLNGYMKGTKFSGLITNLVSNMNSISDKVKDKKVKIFLIGVQGSGKSFIVNKLLSGHHDLPFESLSSRHYGGRSVTTHFVQIEKADTYSLVPVFDLEDELADQERSLDIRANHNLLADEEYSDIDTSTDDIGEDLDAQWETKNVRMMKVIQEKVKNLLDDFSKDEKRYFNHIELKGPFKNLPSDMIVIDTPGLEATHMELGGGFQYFLSRGVDAVMIAANRQAGSYELTPLLDLFFTMGKWEELPVLISSPKADEKSATDRSTVAAEEITKTAKAYMQTFSDNIIKAFESLPEINTDFFMYKYVMDNVMRRRLVLDRLALWNPSMLSAFFGAVRRNVSIRDCENLSYLVYSILNILNNCFRVKAGSNDKSRGASGALPHTNEKDTKSMQGNSSAATKGKIQKAKQPSQRKGLKKDVEKVVNEQIEMGMNEEGIIIHRAMVTAYKKVAQHSQKEDVLKEFGSLLRSISLRLESLLHQFKSLLFDNIINQHFGSKNDYEANEENSVTDEEDEDRNSLRSSIEAGVNAEVTQIHTLWHEVLLLGQPCVSSLSRFILEMKDWDAERVQSAFREQVEVCRKSVFALFDELRDKIIATSFQYFSDFVKSSEVEINVNEQLHQWIKETRNSWKKKCASTARGESQHRYRKQTAKDTFYIKDVSTLLDDMAKTYKTLQTTQRKTRRQTAENEHIVDDAPRRIEVLPINNSVGFLQTRGGDGNGNGASGPASSIKDTGSNYIFTIDTRRQCTKTTSAGILHLQMDQQCKDYIECFCRDLREQNNSLDSKNNSNNSSGSAIRSFLDTEISIPPLFLIGWSHGDENLTNRLGLYCPKEEAHKERYLIFVLVEPSQHALFYRSLQRLFENEDMKISRTYVLVKLEKDGMPMGQRFDICKLIAEHFEFSLWGSVSMLLTYVQEFLVRRISLRQCSVGRAAVFFQQTYHKLLKKCLEELSIFARENSKDIMNTMDNIPVLRLENFIRSFTTDANFSSEKLVSRIQEYESYQQKKNEAIREMRKLFEGPFNAGNIPVSRSNEEMESSISSFLKLLVEPVPPSMMNVENWHEESNAIRNRLKNHTVWGKIEAVRNFTCAAPSDRKIYALIPKQFPREYIVDTLVLTTAPYLLYAFHITNNQRGIYCCSNAEFFDQTRTIQIDTEKNFCDARNAAMKVFFGKMQSMKKFGFRSLQFRAVSGAPKMKKPTTSTSSSSSSSCSKST